MRVLHELNCESRRYWCPTPVCTERSLRVQYPLDRLQLHFLSEHPSMVRRGCRHPFNVRLNSERNDHWFVLALHQIFHMRVEVNVHLSYVAVYVAYIGPRCNISRYTYRVTVDGLSDDRCLVYSRVVHSVLDSYILNLNHMDCFQLCFEQAQNFLLTWNHRGDRASQDHFNFTVEIMTSDSVQESKNVADFSFIE